MKNLYIRYFDDERVVTSVEDALAFIGTFQDFVVTPEFEAEFRAYAEGDMPYPKRVKVRARMYFIVIKTTAETLEGFKENGQRQGSTGESTDLRQDLKPGSDGADGSDGSDGSEGSEKEEKVLTASQRQKAAERQYLTEDRPGWYLATMNFKRLFVLPETGKSVYEDASFTAKLKAHCVQECYDRMMEYLEHREDIDPRSQFPGVKNKNFEYKFLGMEEGC